MRRVIFLVYLAMTLGGLAYFIPRSDCSACEEAPVKRILRDNGLSLTFGLLFLGALIGQAFAGQSDFNNRALADGAQTMSFLQFITSSDFVVDVAENWQSEFLAIGSMVVLSIYLRQRGSPESKPVGAAHITTDEQG